MNSRATILFWASYGGSSLKPYIAWGFIGCSWKLCGRASAALRQQRCRNSIAASPGAGKRSDTWLARTQGFQKGPAWIAKLRYSCDRFFQSLQGDQLAGTQGQQGIREDSPLTLTKVEMGNGAKGIPPYPRSLRFPTCSFVQSLLLVFGVKWMEKSSNWWTPAAL